MARSKARTRFFRLFSWSCTVHNPLPDPLGHPGQGTVWFAACKLWKATSVPHFWHTTLIAVTSPGEKVTALSMVIPGGYHLLAGSRAPARKVKLTHYPTRTVLDKAAALSAGWAV